MRVLFVHEVSYDQKPVFEFQEFLDALAERGNEVAVFDFEEHFSRFSFRRFASSIPSRTNPDLLITRYGPQVSGSSLFARLLAAMLAFVTVPRALLRFRPDVIVNYSVPTFGLPLLIASRVLGIPVVYRAIDVSHLIRPTRLWRLVQVWEKLVCSWSNHISTHNVALRDYCKSMGGSPGRTSIEYPPVHDIFFEAYGDFKEDSQKHLGLEFAKTATVYLCLGTQFSFSGTEQLVHAFSLHESPDDRLLMVGGGELNQALRRMTEGDPRVIFFDFFEFRQIPKILASADVSIVPFEKNLATDCALPQRALLSLAAGLPVLSTPLRGLVTEFGSAGVKAVRSYSEFFDQRHLTKPTKPVGENPLTQLKADAAVSNFEGMLKRLESRLDSV